MGSSTVDQEIIFGDRTSDNIPHIAHEATSSTTAQQVRHPERLATARNSATFYYPTHHYGSASSVSAGQYITAHHVLDGLAGVRDLDEYHLRLPQGWRFDHGDPGNYDDGQGNRLDADEYFHKDSWYRRYRLKSLGLDEFATREWGEDDFATEIFFLSNFEQWELPTGFEDWAGHPDYRDIAVIAIEAKTVDNYESLGPWKVIGPGVFYDFRQTHSYRVSRNEGDSGLAQEPEIGDEVAGFHVHYPLRPESDPPQDYKESLVSYEAIARSDVIEQPCTDSLGNPSYCDQGQYGHLVRTNLDLWKGSSGGGVHWYATGMR